MWKTAHHHILKLVSYEPGKPVEELAREMGLRPEEIIKLASNENPLGPSPKALAAMRDALDRAHFYPDGGGWALRSAIAEKLGLARENVVLGNGSNEIIEFIGHAFLRPGDEVITARHAFACIHSDGPALWREDDRGARSRLHARSRRDACRSRLGGPVRSSSQIPTIRRARWSVSKKSTGSWSAFRTTCSWSSMRPITSFWTTRRTS